MRKLFLPIVAVALLFFSTNAQNTFNKGDKVLNLGVGFGSSLYSGSYYTNKTPPVSASFEVGAKDELFDDKSSLGIGGYLGYTSAKWDYSGYGWKYTDLIIGVRGALHYQLIDDFDTYTGLMLGYDIVSSKAFGAMGSYAGSASASGLAFSWFLGGRYYFSNNIAGLLELGYGISYLNIGIALKL